LLQRYSARDGPRTGEKAVAMAKIGTLPAEIKPKIRSILQRCNFSALVSMLFLGRREHGANVRADAQTGGT
jgi:hypothetical protein